VFQHGGDVLIGHLAASAAPGAPEPAEGSAPGGIAPPGAPPAAEGSIIPASEV
jgi:hypothetical protein